MNGHWDSAGYVRLCHLFTFENFIHTYNIEASTTKNTSIFYPVEIDVWFIEAIFCLCSSSFLKTAVVIWKQTIFLAKLGPFC